MKQESIQKHKRSYSKKTVFYFVLIHTLFALSFFITNIALWNVISLFGYYFIGMLFVVVGYHRYFSHRTFKTSRFFQFILAFMAQVSAQKGVIWWASHHRKHHQYSDTPNDVHSAKLEGFFYSHIGWILAKDNQITLINRIKDLSKYPELMWLNKYDVAPAFIAGALFFIIGYIIGGFSCALSSLLFSFFGGLVLLWHGTFTINSLSHMFGTVRYKTTKDYSRNNWFLAILTLGEGWHNNHHHFMHSARQGFFWYEYDIGYYFIKVLALLKIVKDVRPVPLEKKYAHLQTNIASSTSHNE